MVIEVEITKDATLVYDGDRSGDTQKIIAQDMSLHFIQKGSKSNNYMN